MQIIKSMMNYLLLFLIIFITTTSSSSSATTTNIGMNELVTCTVNGFKVNYAGIKKCCFSNVDQPEVMSTEQFVCILNKQNEGLFKNCVQSLGYAVTVNCDN